MEIFNRKNKIRQFKEPTVCDVQLIPDDMSRQEWLDIFGKYGVVMIDTAKRRNQPQHQRPDKR